ncbi:MAG TPA: protein kinase [Polyangiaceae bacterium]|nr:protein kinase [Polyangiaceae bacterium]
MNHRKVLAGSEADQLQHLPDPLFKPGDLCGAYEVLGLLARGGSADVYRARHLFLDVTRALKIMRRGHRDLRGVRRRFVREARNVVTIEHPNVVKVVDGGEHDGRAWIAMELIPDGLLRSRIQPDKPMPIVAALRHMLAICDGVGAAHQRRLIHRDLKPENIAMKGETPIILDFGIAKRLGLEVALNTSQALLGTPAYASPEYLLSREDSVPVDERTDVYSLGHIAYELFLGRHAYANADGSFPSVVQLVRRQVEPVHGHVTPLTDLIPGFPTYAWAEVGRALSKAVAKRHTNAGEFGAALSLVLRRYLEERGQTPEFYEQLSLPASRLEDLDSSHSRGAPGNGESCAIEPSVTDSSPAAEEPQIHYNGVTQPVEFTLPTPNQVSSARHHRLARSRREQRTSTPVAPSTTSTLPPTRPVLSYRRLGYLTGAGFALSLAVLGSLHVLAAALPHQPLVPREPSAPSLASAPPVRTLSEPPSSSLSVIYNPTLQLTRRDSTPSAIGLRAAAPVRPAKSAPIQPPGPKTTLAPPERASRIKSATAPSAKTGDSGNDWRVSPLGIINPYPDDPPPAVGRSPTASTTPRR